MMVSAIFILLNMVVSIKNLISLLVQPHLEDKQVDCFSIVGSYTRVKTGRKPNDIDCLVLTSQNFSKPDFQKIFDRIEYHDKKILGKSDDSYRLQLGEKEFGLAYFESRKFFEYIQGLIEGKTEYISVVNRPWVVGGKIQEIILKDIVDSIIYFDRSAGQRLIFFKNLLKEKYPSGLRNSLLQELAEELRIKKVLVQKAWKNNDSLLFNAGISDLSIGLIRYVYVKNSVYMSALKHVRENFSHDISDLSDCDLIKKIYELNQLEGEKKIAGFEQIIDGELLQ